MVLGRPDGRRFAYVGAHAMMRLLLNCLCFMSGFWLVVASGLSYAETIPATQGQEIEVYSGNVYGCVGWSGFYSSPSAVCTQAGKVLGVSAGRAACLTTGGGHICDITASCPGGYLKDTVSGECRRTVTAYTCPATGGWTLSGSSCTRPDCSAGQTRNASGVCMTQCPASGTSTAGVTGTPYGGAGTMPATLCINGCSYNWGSVAVQLANSWGATAAKATGQACNASATGSNGTPTESAPPSEPQPNTAKSCIDQGQGFGTVNGVVVCSGPASSTMTKSESSQTTIKPDGSTGTTTQTSVTTCTGAGACTTTTTTNNSGGGAGSGGQPNGTTTTQTDQEKAQFCVANPADPLCKPKADDFCDKNPDAAGCKELGTPSDGTDNLGTKSLGVTSVSVINLATDMSCPPPIQLPRNLGVVSWQPACDFSGLVKPLVLVFAWLSAGLIVIGGIRG